MNEPAIFSDFKFRQEDGAVIEPALVLDKITKGEISQEMIARFWGSREWQFLRDLRSQPGAPVVHDDYAHLLNLPQQAKRQELPARPRARRAQRPSA